MNFINGIHVFPKGFLVNGKSSLVHYIFFKGLEKASWQSKVIWQKLTCNKLQCAVELGIITWHVLTLSPNINCPDGLSRKRLIGEDQRWLAGKALKQLYLGTFLFKQKIRLIPGCLPAVTEHPLLQAKQPSFAKWEYFSLWCCHGVIFLMYVWIQGWADNHNGMIESNHKCASKDRIIKHMEEQSPHGFCTEKSCLTNLLELCEKVNKHVDDPKGYYILELPKGPSPKTLG